MHSHLGGRGARGGEGRGEQIHAEGWRRRARRCGHSHVRVGAAPVIMEVIMEVIREVIREIAPRPRRASRANDS